MADTRLQRRNHGRGHSYKIDGRKVYGVTTVCNTLPKDALTKWAATCAADEAINHWDDLAALPPSERHSRILWAHRNTVKSAATRGTRIHALGEQLANGDQVDVPDEIAGPVTAYAKFLDRWDIEVVATETPVGSPRYGYAGTADAWATIGKLDNLSVLLDLKTGKGVYESTALQLAAYRFAELWQPDKGVEELLPAVDDVFVAHILPDDVRLLPVTADADTFRAFLYLMQTRRWLDDYRDEPLVGAALNRPEDYTP